MLLLWGLHKDISAIYKIDTRVAHVGTPVLCAQVGTHRRLAAKYEDEYEDVIVGYLHRIKSILRDVCNIDGGDTNGAHLCCRRSTLLLVIVETLQHHNRRD